MKNFLGVSLIIILILALAFAAIVVFVPLEQFQSATATPIPPNHDIATAIATYTPVWKPDEVATVVAIVQPTPYVTWSIPDYLGFKEGLKDKVALVASGKLLGAEYSAINAEWYCTDVTFLKWSVPGSLIGNAAVMEATWSIGANLTDISFDVMAANENTPTGELESKKVSTVFVDNGKDPPHFLKVPAATVIIIIKELHVTQANIGYKNEQVFSVADANPLLKFIYISKDLISGNSELEQKRTEAVNKSLERVKIETLMPGGSDKNLVALRTKFILSMTTPGTPSEPHVYDKLIEILTPYAKEMGYSGVQNIVVSLDNIIVKAKDWTDFEGNYLLPENYPDMFAGSVCPNEHPTNLDLSNLGLPTIPGK